MIKRFSIVFLLQTITLLAYSQNDLSGKYWTRSCGFSHGYFVRLFPDSTAHFTPIFEHADDYYKGIWYQRHDTLTIEFSDTSGHSNKFEYFRIKDSLSLEKINRTPLIMSNTLYRLEAYYPNGDIKYKLEYGQSKIKDYIIDGRIYSYHPKKRIKKLIDYRNGVKHGLEINFSRYGYVKSYGKWKNGKKHGYWIYYDSDFNVVGREKYSRGKLKYGDKERSPCFPTWDKEIMEKLYLD